MNIQYYKFRLLGQPFRCGGGGGGGGGGDGGGDGAAVDPGPSDTGVSTIGFDDGSSISIDSSGNVVGVTDAPAGSMGTDIGGNTSSVGETDDGIDPLGPAPDDTTNFATPATDPAATALASLQSELGISAAEAAMMSQSNNTGSNVATNGMTASELGLLAENGLGGMSISDTQTVDQALASVAVNSGLTNNIGQVMGVIGGPVVGMIATAANAVAQGHSIASVAGQIAASIVGSAISNATGLSINASTVNAIANGQIGQAAMGMAIGQVSQSTGLSIATVTAALSGNLGAAVANTVMGQVVGAAAQAMSGGPLGAMAIGAIANQSGMPTNIANSINQSAIGQAVNSATSAVNSSITSAGIGVPGGPSGVAAAVSAASSGADASAPSQSDLLMGAVNSGALANAAATRPPSPGASSAPSRPSSSDKYWQNLYADLGMSFSKPPAQQANNTANEMYANQAKAQALINAEREYTDIFGKLTPDVAVAISASTDPVKYVDGLYTSDSEARDIWRKTVGTNPTEFDLMEIIGLDEGQAGSIANNRANTTAEEATAFFKDLYGKDFTPTDEQLQSVMGPRPEAAAKSDIQNIYTKDKNWVTEDEAAQFWKDTGNTGPVPQEFLDSMLMTTENGAKAMAETYRINEEDIAATTFDGSKYTTPQEAAAAAKAAGFNAFTHKDKNLTYFTQPSPVEEANIRADVEEKKTFSEAFAAARKELGAGKTFTWDGKQYTTNVTPKDTFDASRSSTITTAATLALANGKDKFIGPDGKTYKLDDNAKSVLANSVNQSAAETQRLLNLKPTTDETPAETQRLMESGTRGTMDTIGAMTAQALGTTQRGLGNFLSNAGKTYAAMTGDLNFDNAAIRIGKEIETYAKGNDIYGLDVQKNRLSQAMALANETDNWIEKTKILGSAIGKNSLGFFDVAGSEVVEEIPETILQIGAALMTGGGTLAAKGAVAVIGAAGSVMETFGSTVEETYDKAKKAGASDSEAMNKAYINGVLSTAIEAGTNFVADKAMLAPFLNKFTGTLAGTASGFVSSTAIGAASELAAGLSQSYAMQYMINPETASLSKAATDGIFEMFIGGTAQGTMGLPGYAIQGGAIIGKDYSGKDVTVADVAAGAVLDSSTVNPNATIATSENGDPVTLGGAMLQMPNYQFDMNALKTYVPQVFNNDKLIVGQDELGNDVTFGELTGQVTKDQDFDAVYKSLLSITPEQRTEAKYDYVANMLGGSGYTPTPQEITEFIAQNPKVSQIDSTAIEQYVDPRLVTDQEVRDAYAELGLAEPTQADIDKLVGQYQQEELAGRAQENLGTAQFNVTTAKQEAAAKALADLEAKTTEQYATLTAEQKALADAMVQQGLDLTAAVDLASQQTQAQITGLGEQVDTRINELMQQGQTYQQATQQAIGELSQQNQQLQGLVGTQGRSATQADIDAMSQMLGGQQEMDPTYDVTGDKQITQADIDFLTQVVGGVKTDWTAPQQSPWAATGLYGQIQANEQRRQQDLAAAEAQRQAEQQTAAQAAAERDRQANIRTTATRAQTSAQGIMQQLEAMQRAGMAPQQPAQLVEAGPGFDLSNPLDTGFFSGFQAKKAQQNQQPTTKIAAGGYIDDLLAGNMTADDLLNLLR